MYSRSEILKANHGKMIKSCSERERSREKILMLIFTWLLFLYLSSPEVLSEEIAESPPIVPFVTIKVLAQRAPKGWLSFLGIPIHFVKSDNLSGYHLSGPQSVTYDKTLGNIALLKQYDVVIVNRPAVTDLEAIALQRFVKEGGIMVSLGHWGTGYLNETSRIPWVFDPPLAEFTGITPRSRIYPPKNWSIRTRDGTLLFKLGGTAGRITNKLYAGGNHHKKLTDGEDTTGWKLEGFSSLTVDSADFKSGEASLKISGQIAGGNIATANYTFLSLDFTASGWLHFYFKYDSDISLDEEVAVRLDDENGNWGEYKLRDQKVTRVRQGRWYKILIPFDHPFDAVSPLPIDMKKVQSITFRGKDSSSHRTTLHIDDLRLIAGAEVLAKWYDEQGQDQGVAVARKKVGSGVIYTVEMITPIEMWYAHGWGYWSTFRWIESLIYRELSIRGKFISPALCPGGKLAATAITTDNGYPWETMFKFMYSLGVPLTFYWSVRTKEPSYDYWDSLIDAGLLEIADHGSTHAPWTGMSYEELYDNIVGQALAISKHTSQGDCWTMKPPGYIDNWRVLKFIAAKISKDTNLRVFTTGRNMGYTRGHGYLGDSSIFISTTLHVPDPKYRKIKPSSYVGDDWKTMMAYAQKIKAIHGYNEWLTHSAPADFPRFSDVEKFVKAAKEDIWFTTPHEFFSYRSKLEKVKIKSISYVGSELEIGIYSAEPVKNLTLMVQLPHSYDVVSTSGGYFAREEMDDLWGRVGYFVIPARFQGDYSLRAKLSWVTKSFWGARATEPVVPVIQTPIEGYRMAKWGMSPEEVRKAFPTEQFSELKHPLVDFWTRTTDELLDYFYFKDVVGRQSVTINFYLFDNQLFQVKMHFYSGGLLEYELFKNSLQQKYGSPLEESVAADRKSGSTQWKDGDFNSIKLSFGSKSLLWPGLTISYASFLLTERLRTFREARTTEEQKRTQKKL